MDLIVNNLINLNKESSDFREFQLRRQINKIWAERDRLFDKKE